MESKERVVENSRGMRMLKRLNLDYTIRNNQVKLNRTQIFSKEELTDKVRPGLNDSLSYKIKYWINPIPVSSIIYHFKNGDGLVFIELKLKPGFYTPTISDHRKADRDYYPVRKPFCSDQQ